jgi:hypothetical protein
VTDGPIEPADRHLAERRLLDALRRFHRRQPLRPDMRVDRLIADLRAAEPSRPSAHRGRRPLPLTDAALRDVVDGLVGSGMLRREGHRVSLAGAPSFLDPIMRERVGELIETLANAGPTPPPAEGVAARLGIPAAMLDELRASGELVAAGPRIDYPSASWADISGQLDRLAAAAPLSVRTIRDELGTTRRHAEAILHRYLGWRGILRRSGGAR